ncbi:carboxypeptidase-like regulatory domain-containing protein [Prevotella dentasini]|uniref:carboxypeptidase-like regulatory domain-containing protein n=1 Tax=Prevotella dentasini TaxID=589537 RepID=UPI00055B8B80|nr:carboxypeptidase-like regulatory domain-containing protein [Prevotella dentasini]
MKANILIWMFLFVSVNNCMAGDGCSVSAPGREDSVTVSGRVTDFSGNPVDSCSVGWMSPSFSGIKEVLTNQDGYYSARIRKGTYYAMTALYMPSYPHVEKPFPADKQRLEFWAWNFVADRDTTFNIRYHRMEVYGINAFNVQGATPTFVIYVRPMSLTRNIEVGPGKSLHASDTDNSTTEALAPDAQLLQWAPPASELETKVWIDGELVKVLLKQEIKEYVNANEYCNAYLLTVSMPRKWSSTPYTTFNIHLKDTRTGDEGEGVYYLERQKYVGR